MDRDIQRKRLKYRATHRGTKEADAILGGFVAANIQTLSDNELDALETFLECPDPDISDGFAARWLSQKVNWEPS